VTNPEFSFQASSSPNSGSNLHTGQGAAAALELAGLHAQGKSGEGPPPAKHRNFQFKLRGHPRES